MSFQHLHDFLHMGGYGMNVWLSYGLVCALLISGWFTPWRRFRQYRQQLSDNT